MPVFASEGVWSVIGLVLATACAALPFIVDHKINPTQIAASFALLIAQGAGLIFFMQGQRLKSMAALTLGMLVFSVTAFTATAPALQRLWVSRAIVRQARAIAPCPDFKIVVAGYSEPSLAFMAGTQTKLEPSGTYAAAEMQHDLCRVGVIGKNQLRDFLDSSRDFPTQPYPAEGRVEGVNIGHGAKTELSFYLMPQTREPTPEYP